MHLTSVSVKPYIVDSNVLIRRDDEKLWRPILSLLAHEVLRLFQLKPSFAW